MLRNLYRAALGVIRLILENGLRLNLDRYFDAQLVRHEIATVDGDEESRALLEDLLTQIGEHGVFGAAIKTVQDAVSGALPARTRRQGAFV